MSIGVWVVMTEGIRVKIEEGIASSEQIGVVVSPSTNLTLNVELLETAYDKGIVGYPCLVSFLQDDLQTYAIGQITSIQLRNPHIERHPIKKIISVRGEANPLTAKHDTRQIEIGISAVYSINDELVIPSRMASVPPTGTPVYLLTQTVLDSLMKPHKNEVFYIGRIYNTNILLPMIFKHFGKSGDGRGLGEAYHIGIFGKTGSGKSYLARMVIVAYARHPEMSIVVLDPQGEFSREIVNNGILKKVLQEKLGRSVYLYSIMEISLTSPETLKKMLVLSGFLDKMGVRATENQEIAADLIVSFLLNPSRWRRGRYQKTLQEFQRRRDPSLDVAYLKEVFDQVMEFVQRDDIIRRIYVGESYQERVRTAIETRYDELYQEWKKIALLFSKESGRVSIDEFIQKTLEEKAIVFIDLSEQGAEDIFWNEKVQALILNDIISELQHQGNVQFKQGQHINTLVVVDEAHRFAPREKQEDEEMEALRMNFVDAVRTTRKYGLGWMFISQTIASLHPELINQMRVYFFGYGLSWGSELRTLKELVGGGMDNNYLALYQAFKDPQSSAVLGEREYPFMVFGPVSPLSVSGSPLFITALDYTKEFLEVNNLNTRA